MTMVSDREKWIGDEYRAARIPMSERDAFDAGWQAGAASQGEELWAALRHAQSTVCFFASVIKSGERWSITCQEALEQTLAALPATPPKEANE